MKKIFITLIMLALASPVFAQRDLEKMLGGYVNPEELVTLSETMPFNQAIDALNRISEKYSGKTIVSTVESSAPIGIPIQKLQYKKALTLIVQYADLVFEEKEASIVVKKRDSKELPKEDIYASVDSREVKISAVFFESDVAEMRDRGISWKSLLSNTKEGYAIGSEFRTFTEQDPNQKSGGAGGQQNQGLPAGWDLKPKISTTFGDFSLSAEALFKLFETENLGEIIASPSVTVRDNQPGRIQIGSDFSIKQRDFAGNTTEKFFSTGSIIEVTPHYYNEDGVDYVLLNLTVERSSAIPSEVTTEIKKTQASTQVLMLNGEETVIGGLFVNDEVIVKTGIPILRDLPWWVFGLKYIFGSEQKQIKKKEVVILIKTELLPTLKERMNNIKSENKIKSELRNHDDQIKKYRINDLKNK